MNKNCNYEFPVEFQHVIADMLEICQKNKTDTLGITLNYGKYDLGVELTFSVNPHEGG